MKQTIVYGIGVEATIEVIGGKWKSIILCYLKHDTRRPSELKRLIPTITKKMLTQQLRELEDSGVINRTVYEQVPPKVEYSLSTYGRSLEPVLELLCIWGEEHIERRKTQFSENIILEHTEL